MSSRAKSSSEDTKHHKQVLASLMPRGRKSLGQGARSQMSVTVQTISSMRTSFNHIIIFTSPAQDFYVLCSILSCILYWYERSWAHYMSQNISVLFINHNFNIFVVAFCLLQNVCSLLLTCQYIIVILLGPAPRTYNGSWSDLCAELPSSFSFTFWQWQNPHTPMNTITAI